MSIKREFTGVFIPAHIWTCKELIPAEKMLLGEIAALSTRTGWCEASREHFAEWLQCDPTNISHYTAKLEKLGFLEVKRTPGARSKMRVVADRFYVDEGVNEAHGGSESRSRVGVNPIHGGGESHSPEIKEKENSKIKVKETPHPGKPDTVTPEKPNESKPDFSKLSVEEQLRAVYLYAQRKLAAVDSEAITPEEKAEKRVKYSNTLTALLNSEFRAVIEQYKQYRKGNKRIGKAGKWYDTEVTLCAVVAKLAELAGITNGAVNMANVRRIYEQTVENSYVGFYQLKTPKESTTKQPTQNTQPSPRDVQGFNAIAEF